MLTRVIIYLNTLFIVYNFHAIDWYEKMWQCYTKRNRFTALCCSGCSQTALYHAVVIPLAEPHLASSYAHLAISYSLLVGSGVQFSFIEDEKQNIKKCWHFSINFWVLFRSQTSNIVKKIFYLTNQYFTVASCLIYGNQLDILNLVFLRDKYYSKPLLHFKLLLKAVK